jgi:DUF3043 family protein
VPSLFRRRDADADSSDGAGSADTATEPVEDEETPAEVQSKSYTPGKGRPTPKRKDAQRRTAEPPPSDRKEAARRLRQKQQKERAEARQRMMAGDEKYLPPRDRGPERAVARDVVDSRRNVGGYFLIAALVILIGTSSGMPPVVQFAAQFLWYALALAFIADCIVLSRRVRKTIKAKQPKTTVRFGGIYLYAVMRSITFRRLRMPSPRVKLGEKLT